MAKFYFSGTRNGLEIIRFAKVAGGLCSEVALQAAIPLTAFVPMTAAWGKSVTNRMIAFSLCVCLILWHFKMALELAH